MTKTQGTPRPSILMKQWILEQVRERPHVTFRELREEAREHFLCDQAFLEALIGEVMTQTFKEIMEDQRAGPGQITRGRDREGRRGAQLDKQTLDSGVSARIKTWRDRVKKRFSA